MPAPKYPKEAASADWNKEVGGLDSQKVGELLKKLELLHAGLPSKLFDTDGLTSAEQARERLDEAIDAGGKAAKALSDQARAVRTAVDKIVVANKKNSKAAKAIKHAEAAAAAAEALGKEVVALSASSALAIKKLCDKLEEAEEKAKEKDKAPAPTNPKLLAHNTKVRGIVNKLRAGTHPRTPFALLQNKVRLPFNKAKPWAKKSILHVGPRALKSCRSELEKLMAPDTGTDFLFFFGEVEGQGPKGKLKLVFEFESPLGNPKQMKDALLFQCKYSPPMQLRKQGSAEVIDEAAEGDEKDAEEEADEAHDASAKAGWQAAKPGEDAEITKARAGLLEAQVKLRSGIGTLMQRVTTVYKGVSGRDLEAVKGALRKLDALHKKLDVDVGGALAEVAKAKDASDRARRKKAALDKVAALGAVVAGDDLMDDIDRNQLMPSLVVVAPLKDKLKQVIGALR